MADQMTWGRLDQLIQRADARNQSFHATVKVMRGHRFRTRPVDIPAEYKKTSQEFRSPLPFDQIQRVVAALTGDTTDRPITVRVVPRTEDDEERHNTTIKEKFIVSMMDAMDKDKHDSVWQMGIDAAVGDGKGIIHLRYHPGAYSAKSGFPQIKNFNELGDEDQNLAKWQAAVFQFKKSSRLPMSWENVDVLNYLPIMAPGGKRTAVIEAHHLDIEVLQKRFEQQGYVPRVGSRDGDPPGVDGGNRPGECHGRGRGRDMKQVFERLDLFPYTVDATNETGTGGGP